MKNLFLFLTIIAFAVGCQSNSEPKTDSDADSPNSLIGVWDWVSTSYSDQDTSYQWTNVDGLMILTENYYSIIYVYSSEPRKSLPDVESWGDLTKEQLVETLDPMGANSGTYELETDSIKLNRKVALWPNGMNGENLSYKLPLPILKDNNTIVWKLSNGDHTWKRLE